MTSPQRSKVNMDDLLSSLDHIPTIMTEMMEERSFSSRGARSSSDFDYMKQKESISAQAGKVLDRLAKLAEDGADSGYSSEHAPAASLHSRASSASINYSQIQDALKEVSVQAPSNSRTAPPSAEKMRPVPASNITNTAMDTLSSQAAAASIPLTAYEALARLAEMPQRRHYVPPSSSDRRMKQAQHEDEDLNNPVISVFDLARTSTVPHSEVAPKVRVSDLLSGSVAASWVDHQRDNTNGRRFGYSRNKDVTSFAAPLLEHPLVKVRSTSAPPRSAPRPLLAAVSEKRTDQPSRAPPVEDLSQQSLYNAIYSPKKDKSVSSEVSRGRSAVRDSDARVNATGNGRVFPDGASEGRTPRRAVSATKAFRTSCVPDKDEHVSVDPADVAKAENAIIAQLNGTAGGLRRVLQRADPSRSGKLNYDDFRLALRRSGILLGDDRVNALFFSNSALVNNDHGYYGYTGGRALDIENFVTKVATKSSAPLFSHIAGHEKAKTVKEAEENRVLRKVVHATNKLSDPMLVFRTLEPRQKRYITANQFREGLTHIGASLNDEEFSMLMKRVDLNHDGRIDVGEFQTMLNSEVQAADRAAISKRHQDLTSHSRYTDTYKSNALLQTQATSEFGHIRDSQVVRREDFRWSKLKAQLQKEKDAILKAFSRGHGRGRRHVNQDAGYSVGPVTLAQLTSRLADEGVYLCDDDAERLRVHVDRLVGEEQKAMSRFGGDVEQRSSAEPVVGLDSFCDMLGIPRQVTRDHKTVLLDPRYKDMDGGVFAASSKSLMGNPTFGTTYFVSGEEDGIYVKGNTKRKIPQPLYGHSTVAHKFWELEQTIGGPELTVSPIPSQREPYIVPFEIGTNRPMTPSRIRGKKMVSSDASNFSDSSTWAMRTPFAVSGNTNGGVTVALKASKGRSNSAPPRSGSSVASLLHDVDSYNGRRPVRSGDSVVSQSSNYSSSTRSVQSASRGNDNPNRIRMSLADFIQPSTPFDAAGVSSRRPDDRRLTTLRRSGGGRPSSSVPYAVNY